MPTLLNIGLSGLTAARNALNVTGHNVSNVNTVGYTRQEAIMATRTPEYSNDGYLGTGVNVVDVRRLASDFLSSQLRNQTSLNSELSAFRSQVEELDLLLANTEVGLAPALQSFFSAMQTAVEDPRSITARRLLLTEADGLSERFNLLYGRLETQNQLLNQQLTSNVEKVNQLATEIAGYNEAIVGSRSAGREPNDLLDKRDEAVRKLSELVGNQVVVQDGTQFNIYIGNGQPLVVGKYANSLSAVPGTIDPTRLEINFNASGASVPVTDSISGGSLSGLVEYRDSVLDVAFNSLGRLALSVSQTLNNQLGQGLDLAGNAGANLFNDVNDALLAAQRIRGQTPNTGSITANVTISDASRLGISDYELQVVGTNYRVVRLSDNTEIIPSTAIGAVPFTIDLNDPALDATVGRQGFAINITAGTLNDGDRYTLLPTRRGSATIDMVLQQPEQLAFAAPVRAESTLQNRGTGAISQPSLVTGPSPIDPAALSGLFGAGISLTYTGAPATLTPSAGTLTQVSPAAYTPGVTNTLQLTVGAYTVEFTVSGVPHESDTFTLGFNSGGVSDNRNGLALVGLQSAATVAGTSYNDAYGDLVERIGALSAQARTNTEASQVLVDQATSQRNSLSGVSLDEEAGNLIKFQQYYQANAQVIQIARSIFDSLLSAFN